jgi:hypothetical protein
MPAEHVSGLIMTTTSNTDGKSRRNHQNQTIDVPQPNPLSTLTVQHQQLLAQDQDLRLPRGARLKHRAECEQDPNQQREHRGLQ